MKIPFTKMHGAGNDFVMINGIENKLPKNLKNFSKQICHRHFGIGADQVLIARESQKGDFTMVIYNADGGEVEMCGNGIRCFFKFLHEQKLTQKTHLKIETLAGIIEPTLLPDHPKTTSNTVWVKVNMGKPILDGAKIPVQARGKIVNYRFVPSRVKELLPTDPQSFLITSVSMGNPHCVIFVDDVKKFPVARIGSLIETDPFFPKRVNVEFVQIKNRQHLLQRTWERGSGETYACGTGASAVAVAAVLNNFADRELTISLKGGDLDLFWDEKNNQVFKTGPATTVFEGVAVV